MTSIKTSKLFHKYSWQIFKLVWNLRNLPLPGACHISVGTKNQPRKIWIRQCCGAGAGQSRNFFLELVKDPAPGCCCVA